MTKLNPFFKLDTKIPTLSFLPLIFRLKFLLITAIFRSSMTFSLWSLFPSQEIFQGRNVCVIHHHNKEPFSQNIMVFVIQVS